MAHFPKPAEGSWTEHFPQLGTAPVNYEDSISPEYYELEKAAIFKQTWLNVGRVEQLPRVGSYFTKELDCVDTSIIVVRDRSGVRAFHNMCRHRGNKLVWQDYPNEEVKGTCRQFTCKYHGWRYGLDGELNFVQQESEFFDLDKADYPLVSVHCETWEGFIFVNFAAEPAETLLEFLGEVATGLSGYPFGEMTQTFGYRAVVGANWKLFNDAFSEFYHAPVLHLNQAVASESAKLQQFGFEALHYDLFGDSGHGIVSTWGGMSPPKDLEMVKPIERILHSGLFGPWEHPPGIDLSELPPGLNPARHRAWGADTFQVFPNYVILVWERGWYLTYHYWPLAYDKHLFEGRLYFAPPRNATDRMRQELAAVTFKEYALQDGNTLEATQRSLKSRAATEFPLCDQEILPRNLHKTVADRVRAHRTAIETAVAVAR